MKTKRKQLKSTAVITTTYLKRKKKMETKFCPSCQQKRNKEGFKLVTTSSKNHKRWKCAVCLAKKSETIYRSVKNDPTRTTERTT